MALKMSLKNTCLIPFWGILGFRSWRMLCDLADFVHMSGTIEVLLTPASVQILVMGQWGMLHNHWSGKNKPIKKGRHHTNSSFKIIFFELKHKTLTGKVVGLLLWRDGSFFSTSAPIHIFIFNISDEIDRGVPSWEVDSILGSAMITF